MVLLNSSTSANLAEDRLSNLPWHILARIFSFLTIFEAIRTSVLCKEWRYKWLLTSSFQIDSETIPFGPHTRDRKWEIISSIVNKYLNHHSGLIKQFSLRSECTPHYPDLFQWIRYLANQDVEVLFIEEYCMVHFTMPSPLFSFKKLKKLILGNCALRIPSDFEGFNSLCAIVFNNVHVFNDEDLNRLILSCPNLERLVLVNISGLKVLIIHSLKLIELHLDTGIKDLIIEDAPRLASVTFNGGVTVYGERVVFNPRGILSGLLGLNSIEKLVISGEIIEFVANDCVFGNLQWRNSTLTRLEFHDMSFETIRILHVCLSLLRCCPSVHFLYFSFESAKGPKLITKFLKQNQGRFSFPELMSLKMRCLESMGMGPTVNLLEFISAHSPNLKYLTLEKEGENTMNNRRVRQILSRLMKQCPQASVRYLHGVSNTDGLIYL